MHHSDKDPIIAVATAAGRGGIGILRLSFGKALEAQIVGRLFGENCTLKARYAHLLPFLGTDGGVLDRAIVLLFPAPHSYTGESVLEIQAHGGPVLLSLIMRTCLEKCRDLGLRMAEPGEFTRRAFMNGRMDLTQAEAVADLIDAVSESAVQAAGRSLSGEFSNAVRDVDGNITELRAFIEATLDFPEEDIDVIGSEKVRTRLVQAETGIRAILENARQGQVLREGVTVAIVGSPNVGKSSLLNALAQEEVAIVTDIPGTTRDAVEQTVTLGRHLLRLLDTAGIRDTSDTVEHLGVERSFQAAQSCQLAFFVVDGSKPLTPEDEAAMDAALQAPEAIAVLNKQDLPCVIDSSELPFSYVIPVSCAKQDGLDLLEQALDMVFDDEAPCDGSILTNARQADAIAKSRASIEAALSSLRLGMTPDAVLVDVEAAMEALGEATGRVVREDITNRIFERFCVGK